MCFVQTQKKFGASLREASLRTILIFAFLLQIFVAFEIVEYWPLRNGQTVMDLVDRLQLEQGDRSFTHHQTDGLHIIYQPGLHSQTLINDVFNPPKIEVCKLKIYPTVSHLRPFLDDIISSTQIQTIKGVMRFQRKGVIYPKQPDECYISFASKIKDSVQQFLEKAIATPVERYLYPERSL